MTTTPNPHAGLFAGTDASLTVGTHVAGFTVNKVERIDEIDGCAYVMSHDATGARAMWLACPDTERAFAIAFKTPPTNDTGVFHILEHSVLCGSERFPVKEPFVNLLKTSMQTFLNALTFSDKTMYPVASTNERDLENLMDVYLDAVFHPAIYSRPRIFEQEGWHYELEGADAPLTYNGVVFNEMKGALSDPEEHVFEAFSRALFPDNAYCYLSGGDPEAIPELTYEEFCDTHTRHYNPANSYTTLYGDLDLEHFLAFLGERLDNAAQARTGALPPNPLTVQPSIAAPTMRVEMATNPDNAIVALTYVFARSSQRERVMATDVLLDALMGSNEAPLKRAVLDSGLGDDLSGYLLDGLLQPVLVFELRGAKPGCADKFRALVEDTCRELVDKGLGHDNLASSLAQAEFNLREGDWGYPDGVAMAINAMSSWLYDDEDSTSYLHYEDELAHMHAGLDNGYFERLLAEVTYDCDHSAMIDLVPTTKEVDKQTAKLADAKGSMDDAALEAIMAEAAALHEEQAAPDSPESLATLPVLSVDDLAAAAPEPAQEAFDAPLPCVRHAIPTRKINYLYHYFDIDCVSWDELPYVKIMCLLYGRLDTASHTAAELDILIEEKLGTLSMFAENYGDAHDATVAKPKLVVAASALTTNLDAIASIPAEVWGTTSYDDHGRIRDVLTQMRIGMEQHFVGAGHSAALARLASYTNAAAAVSDQMGGVNFYLFLKDLLANFDERVDELTAHLRDLSGRLFRADNVEVSFTGTAEETTRFWQLAGDLGLTHEPAAPVALEIPELKPRSEAFIVPADVCYVSRGRSLGDTGLELNGSWLVTQRVLSFDYLWNEVRVHGGAYGCGFRCTQQGDLQLYSYRDPAVDPTIKRFDDAAAWLGAWTPSTEEFAGYVVSSVASHDAPVKPRSLARKQDGARLSGKPEGWRERIREELLGATPDSVRALATDLAKISEQPSTCVFGGRDIIGASTASLDVIELVGDGHAE